MPDATKATAPKAPSTYDPAQTLTNSIMAMVWLLALFLGAIVGFQIWTKGSADTASWGQFAFVIGWATAKAGDIFNNRFGSTLQSAAKDQTIQQQARTAAVAQGALLDPAVSVVVDPSKRDAKSPPVPPIVPGEQAEQPIRADTVNVAANVANVTEAEPTGKETP